jgi:hypothetical protein
MPDGHHGSAVDRHSRRLHHPTPHRQVFVALVDQAQHARIDRRRHGAKAPRDDIQVGVWHAVGVAQQPNWRKVLTPQC